MYHKNTTHDFGCSSGYCYKSWDNSTVTINFEVIEVDPGVATSSVKIKFPLECVKGLITSMASAIDHEITVTEKEKKEGDK